MIYSCELSASCWLQQVLQQLLVRHDDPFRGCMNVDEAALMRRGGSCSLLSAVWSAVSAELLLLCCCFSFQTPDCSLGVHCREFRPRSESQNSNETTTLSVRVSVCVLGWETFRGRGSPATVRWLTLCPRAPLRLPSAGSNTHTQTHNLLWCKTLT